VGLGVLGTETERTQPMTTILSQFETFAASLPLEVSDDLLIEEELEALVAILSHSEPAAILYEHYLEVWLTIHFKDRVAGIASACDRWDEGFWAAPGDWVEVPNQLKLAHDGCKAAWTHAWTGTVLPLPPFGSLISDPPYADCDAYTPCDPEDWF